MRRITSRTLYLSFAVVLVLVLLAACGEDEQGADPPTATPAPAATATPTPDSTATTAPQEGPLEDSEWILTEIDGAPALEDTMVTLEFNKDGAGGYSGCNWYGGQYSVSENSIDITQGATTDRGCSPQSILDQEQRYFELLGAAETFDVTDTALTLLNAEGDTTLTFTRREAADMDPGDLVGTTWQLTSHDGTSAIGPPSVLTFDDDSRYSTRDGCYNYAGTYTASGDRLSTQGMGPTASACLQPSNVQSHVASLTNALDDVAYYRLSDDGAELHLTHYDGKVATLARVTDMPPDDAWSITWLLNSIIADGLTELLLEGTEITLLIPNPSLQLNQSQLVSGSSGCNTYQASLTAGVDTLTISEIIMTDMGCTRPPGVMDQEQRYLELLGDVTSHNFFEQDALQLVIADGTTLVFRPTD